MGHNRQEGAESYTTIWSGGSACEQVYLKQNCSFIPLTSKWPFWEAAWSAVWPANTPLTLHSSRDSSSSTLNKKKKVLFVNRFATKMY